MAKWQNDLMLDAALDYLRDHVNQITLCSAAPSSFAQAADHAAWQATHAYTVGQCVIPTTRNGYAYECTTAGTSGGTEPTWVTTPGTTNSDGSAVWTCRNHYFLAGKTVSSSDMTKADGTVSGRRLIMAELTSITVAVTGTGTHFAMLKTTDLTHRYDTTCLAIGVTASNVIVFAPWDIELRDPT